MAFDSNIFFSRIVKSVFSSFLFTYVIAFLISLRTIFSFTFNVYIVFYVPIVLVAISVFVLIALRKYVRKNAACSNRFLKIVKGLSIQTLSCATLCSVIALFLSMLNPFCHDGTVGRLLYAGSALAGAMYHYETIYSKQDFHFPIIQTTKYSMFMSKQSKILLKSAKKSFLYSFFIMIALYIIEPKLCADVYFYTLLCFSVSLVLYFFNSFEHIVYLTMTERVIFPIVTIKQDGHCLLNALNDDKKIIRSLALYDLYQASIEDEARRKDIFSLSFARSIPQSWKIIFNYCINNIKSTTEDLSNSVKHISPKLINRRAIPNARLLNLNGLDSSKQKEENKKNKLLIFFENFRVYNYFFESLEKEKTLEEFEATVWCCYILSNLAVVSLKEDEYGIVREQLGPIVSSILDLKNQLELQRIHFENHKVKKIEYLKTHVKTCAVLLALNFAMYVNDIGLDENQLHSFNKIITSLNNS